MRTSTSDGLDEIGLTDREFRQRHHGPSLEHIVDSLVTVTMARINRPRPPRDL